MGTAGEQRWRQPGLPRDTAGTAERCHKVPEDAAGLSERCCRVLAVLCRMGVKCHRVPRAAAGLSVVPIQGLCQQHCPIVQCSHGTSLKPAMPSLCPCPAELTPYTPHSSNQTISVLHPPPHPHPLCPSPGCASSRQGTKALSCPCLAPGYCWAPALPSPAWAQLEEATSFWSFPVAGLGFFFLFVCLLEICVDSCLSLTSPCVTWGSPLGAAP